jgi:hypothetical protein
VDSGKLASFFDAEFSESLEKSRDFLALSFPEDRMMPEVDGLVEKI